MNTINCKSVELTDEGLRVINNAKTESLRDKNAEAILEHKEQVSDEEKNTQYLPRVTAPIEALGLESWQDLEKKLVRRLDMTLMPMLWVLYLFSYLERALISQARLTSFEADLMITDTQFATAVAVLVPDYVAAQIPSNMILPYVRPSLYLPCCAIFWSGVYALMAGFKSYNGLVACRVVLGLCEASLLPGAIYVMSSWYTRKEIALRTAVLYQAYSGLIATGVYEGLEGSRGMAGWQWLFVVLALAECCCALVAMVLLPDYPHSETGSARSSLTEDIRLLAIARIQADRVSLPLANSTSIWYGLKLTCMDYKTWIFRSYHMIGPVIVAIMGYTVCTATSNVLALYAASFSYIGVGTLGHTPEKRATAIPVINVLGQIGNRQPRYLMAFLLMTGFAVIGVAFCLLLKFFLIRSNKKL
ncbi:major facilitator superfamily domain-containing protein [Colletotrichum navitas]|uniref:Major facilitator superfamily domain-containing protein n=1 Tax=Colletotrichum navitas TaxID=681940 RepID=A0AAD8PNA0_9PEZI|nr:major facilitator superfamily domain-containing protein [Colletotrichum navitas]KAK1573152.1 major facilitator superfamily domain-containing protein [Colletotrichum navitas]